MKAWVRPLHGGPGTVGIAWIESDGGQSLGVAERLAKHLSSVAPATATIVPVILQRIPIKIDFSITPNNPTLLKDVCARLRKEFLRLSEPPGFFHYHERKTLDAIPRSRIEDIIRAVPGVDTYEVKEMPKLTCNLGEILTLA